MTSVNVNADLVRERSKASFDISELTTYLDGGKEGTELRKKIGKFLQTTHF